MTCTMGSPNPTGLHPQAKPGLAQTIIGRAHAMFNFAENRSDLERDHLGILFELGCYQQLLAAGQ